MRLGCPSCGGQAEYEAATLRRGLIVCIYCDTISRVSEAGIVPTHDGGCERHPDVRVEEAPQQLSIAVRLPEGLVHLRLGDFKTLAIATSVPTLATTLWAGVGAGLLAFIGAGFIGVVGGIAYVKRFRKWSRPLIIEGQQLGPPSRLPVSEIRQLYATASRVTIAGQEVARACNVYALTGGGRRVHVFGPMSQPEVALEVEAVVENHLGIFDLAVEGESPDAAAGRAIVHAPAGTPASPPSSGCEGCGGAITLDEAAKRRGVAVCPHCNNLTLLYAPGSRQPLLGASDRAPKSRRFRVEDTPEALVVTGRDGIPRLRVTSDAITARGHEELARASIAAVFARPRAVKQGLAMSDLVGAFKGAIAQAARSGDIDLAHSLVRFSLVAKTESGEELSLLDDFEDALEVLEVRSAVSERLSLGAGGSGAG